MCVTCSFYNITLGLFLIHFLISISITLYLCVSFVMFLLCKHMRLTCVFNKLMMMMMMMKLGVVIHMGKVVFMGQTRHCILHKCVTRFVSDS